jgi:hypothetical protein
MLYEFRCYDAAPGRLQDLHRRFKELTLALFERHGIEPLGFWVDEAGSSDQLNYLLRWKDMADREDRWARFLADPDWQRGRAASEAHGPIVLRVTKQFWSPTAYSDLQ